MAQDDGPDGDGSGGVSLTHSLAFTDGHFVVGIVELHEHRRATVDELRQHFAMGTSHDYPSHWFEAQLVHYGLEPSKCRAVARTRLHDALNAGTLAVPGSMAEMENRFKADWFIKNGALDSDSSMSTSTKTTTMSRSDDATTVIVTRPPPLLVVGKKRNAEDDADSEFAIKSKKSKPSSPRSTPDGSSLAGAGAEGKAYVRRKKVRSPFALELHRCFDGGGESEEELSSTATSSSQSSSSSDEDSFDGELAPLSDPFRLNGRYNIRCPNVAENYPHSGGGTGYNLVFAVAGPRMWAKFRLGLVEGVMYFSEKPGGASYDRIPFSWRGRESGGPLMKDDEANKGWIEFLGAGRVRGQLDYRAIGFNGQRCLAPPDLTPIDAFTMQKLWNRYAEAESQREPLLPFWG